MYIRVLRVYSLIGFMTLFAACATSPASRTAVAGTPPPAQNLLGTTDELQLVTELALDLADTYGGDKVLVALDIDNTLLVMEQDLGSDQWFYWQTALAGEDDCNALRVDDHFAVQGALFHASAMRPTQANAAEQLRRMQDAGLKVIALTSRGPEYRLQTFRELRRNGMAFWPSAWAPQRGYPRPFTPEGAASPVHYEDGVYFVSGQDKGAMLNELLHRSGEAFPTLVVAVDDQQEHLNAIMQAFSFKPTKVHAWRYSREDDKAEAFNAVAADAHWDAIEPALRRIQEILGPDNYRLPERSTDDCASDSDG
ncbi:MAG: DUF2608 domain-containing protein [Xanthomonadales bacterium]|nr:DUF2608 domain-containing protein [Xanthomonadales bacterium]